MNFFCSDSIFLRRSLRPELLTEDIDQYRTEGIDRNLTEGIDNTRVISISV